MTHDRKQKNTFTTLLECVKSSVMMLNNDNKNAQSLIKGF